MSNTLTEMIDQLVLEKTVSLEALNSINALKQQAILLEGQLKAADEKDERSRKQIGELAGLSAERAEQISQLNEKIKQLENVLGQAHKTELEGKEAKAELKGFTSAMQMVFKPSVVRETIQKTVPVGVPGGHGAPGWVSKEQETGTVERSAE